MLKNENKIIHSLWIGMELSPVELLTINSFIKNGHEFHLWVYEIISTPLPEGVKLKNASEIIPKDKVFRYKNKNQFGHGKGSYAGFSDIFRYKLLYECGGWWVDMDLTCLKPFNFEEPYIFRPHHTLKVVGNIMKCPKNSQLMKDCYEMASQEIDENNTDWHKPVEILNKMIIKHRLDKYIKEISNHDSWDLVRRLIIKNQKIPDHWYGIHWINEEWRRNKIDRNYAAVNSVYFNLLHEYEVRTKIPGFSRKLIYRLKLSWLFAALKQAPSFILYQLKIKK